jgi:hypothetical protein
VAGSFFHATRSEGWLIWMHLIYLFILLHSYIYYVLWLLTSLFTVKNMIDSYNTLFRCFEYSEYLGRLYLVHVQSAVHSQPWVWLHGSRTSCLPSRPHHPSISSVWDYG